MTRDIVAWPEQAVGGDNLAETKEAAMQVGLRVKASLGPYGCYFDVDADGMAWCPPPWLVVLNDVKGNIQVTVDPDVLVREWDQLTEGFHLMLRRVAELEAEIVAAQSSRNGTAT